MPSVADPSARTAALARASEALEQESLGLLESLIVAAERGADAVEAILHRALRDAECDTSTLEYDPRAVPLIDEFAATEVGASRGERCLIGRVEGAAGGRSLILFAHPDTEAFQREPAWRTDPFVPSRRDGRLHGWGVADDLAGVAMLVQAIRVLREAGLCPGGDVVLVSAPSKKHRRGIAAALHHGLAADAAVYLHPAESGRGLDEIKAFAPGQLEFQITVSGRPPDTSEPAHTAFAHTAVNPFDQALTIVAALRRLDDERGAGTTHPRLQEAIGRSANLMLSHCAFGAGRVLSRMPETCQIGGAMTLVPGEGLEAVREQFEAAIDAAARQDPWLAHNPPRINWLAGVTAAETPEDSPIYRTVDKALRRFGADPRVNPLHTSSDIRNPIVQKGIPTVGFGPLCGGLAMSGLTDEWVDIGSLVKAIAVTAEIIVAWSGTEESHGALCAVPRETETP